MRNKALHTIFPDKTIAPSDSPAQTAFAQLLPAAQNQSGDSASNTISVASPSSGLSGISSDPAQTSGQSAASEVLTDVSKNLDRLRAVTESQITETTANTAALGSNTAAKSVAQTVASVSNAASGFLGGLTSIPLISGLVKLFGGGSSTPSTPPPLPKYQAPASLAFDEAVTSGSGGSQISEPTYDQFGNPKVSFPENTSAPSVAQLFSQLIPDAQNVSPPSAAIGLSDTSSPDYSALLATIQAYTGQQTGDANTTSATQNSVASPVNSSVAGSNTQVTVNVQAMDSRSFLDRSQDIAQAVREAMLNMHSINDVVNDL